jgi:5-formyltetrahydrofolate cyclo-ligase
MDLAAQKSAARAEALARRANCEPALGAKLAAHVLEKHLPPAGAIIAGFWPLDGEIAISPLLNGLAERGYKLCLPVTPKRGEPLNFRSWMPGDALEEGRFKTMHPKADIAAIPDYILTPLLAYDRFGHRLGYGAGYYDRTFAALQNAFRLGCAFSAQEVPNVPNGPNDISLNAIATERGVFNIKGCSVSK